MAKAKRMEVEVGKTIPVSGKIPAKTKNTGI